ncbi:hypothetical protein [Aliarcobacter butzleri]|uniref:hypothetical protein n=1 Tax=Aliarcobacter butzleri TaxID=28197 RepID=UPI002B24C32E|nr:hypothetical protein [Aliarcobacter butzleri]
MINKSDKTFSKKFHETIKNKIKKDERLISERSKKNPKIELLIALKSSILLLMENLYSIHEQLYLINHALDKKTSITLGTYLKYLENYLEDDLQIFRKNSYFATRLLKIKKAISNSSDYKIQFDSLAMTGNINGTIKLDLSVEDYIYFVKKYIEINKLEKKKKLVTPHQIIVPNINPIGGKALKKEKIPGDTLEDILEHCKDNSNNSNLNVNKNKILSKKENLIIYDTNEERNSLKNDYGLFELKIYPGTTINNIIKRFEIIEDKNLIPEHLKNNPDFMFAKLESDFSFSEPFIFLRDKKFINAINPNSYGLTENLLIITDTIRDKDFKNGYLFFRYYKNKFYLIEHYEDYTKSIELVTEFNKFANNNSSVELLKLYDEFYNL